MNPYKKYLLLLLIPIPLFIAFGILAYIYDPLQIYHKPYFRENTFFRDMRLSAKGIIKNYDFDSYVLGSSMLENTSSQEATMRIGGNWANISMSGSNFYERSLVLDYILSNQTPRDIIYSLDSFKFSDYVLQYGKEFETLYDDNSFNDFKIYLLDYFLRCFVTFSQECSGVVKLENLDLLINWYQMDFYRSRFGGRINWINYYTGDEIKKALKELYIARENRVFIGNTDISQNVKDLQKFVIKHIKNHPNTNFHLVLPTHFRPYFRATPSDDFTKWSATIKWLVFELEKYPNAKVYGLDLLDYADDITKYKDNQHYAPDMNSIQLYSIAQKINILTPQNVDAYFMFMQEKINAYNVEPLINILEQALKFK